MQLNPSAMFNFIKRGVEYNNLAKSFNGMNIMLQNLIPQTRNNNDQSDFTEEIMVLAYIARRGVMDRIKENDSFITGKIYVPSISRGKITVMYAITQTVHKLQMIASQLELSDIMEEIMEKRDAYYELERNLPTEITKNI